MEDVGSFGERLKYAISIRDLTQSDLAEELDLSQSTVSDYVRGEKHPRQDKLKRLSQVLDVEPKWLFLGEGQKPYPDMSKLRSEYQDETGWQFRKAPIDGGRDYGNANLFSFDPDIDTVVRETAQNAKDQALSDVLDRDSDKPVRLVYKLITLREDALETFLDALNWEDLKPHYEAIVRAENNQKTLQRIKQGFKRFQKRIEEKKEIRLLRIDDYNTTGLTGEEHGEGHFTALCRNNLDSHKGSGTSRGGTYGLGKASLWLCSDISIVLFNSEPYTAGSDGRRVFGRSEMTWHEVRQNGEADSYAGPGWFGKLVSREDEEGRSQELAESYWDNPAITEDLSLERQDGAPGSSILIVGFENPASDGEETMSAIADEIEEKAAEHFWPAIEENDLEVEVEVYENDRRIRGSEVQPENHVPNYVDAYRAFINGETGDDLTVERDEGRPVAARTVELEIPGRDVPPDDPDIPTESVTHEALLLVRSERESEGKNYVSFFRGARMIVKEDGPLTLGVGSDPFSAVVVCGEAVGDTPSAKAAELFLQTCEPPSHDDWCRRPLTQATKDLYEPGAGRRLKEFLVDRVRSEIRELVRPLPEDFEDGPDDLKRLLRLDVPSSTPARPTLSQPRGKVNDNGVWEVEVPVKSVSQSAWRITPAVTVVGETGRGARLDISSMKSIDNCEVKGKDIFIPRGNRRAKFEITTVKPPIPAGESTINVSLKETNKQ
ncbi:helix-turn-helix domain-containing protein [Salinibacter ruber]|uniref:helix-turn-helix domain-containing protein n=1 Tax=Salinibacter ruber TaxID=146919 RepID=UPI002168F356|nr:helix-turn-helix transcriptional regulator [Salinibacter ruber]MCS3782679.1 transcriptional regulator with XRE-family HTH domain [Salinibacter ruber]